MGEIADISWLCVTERPAVCVSVSMEYTTLKTRGRNNHRPSAQIP